MGNKHSKTLYDPLNKHIFFRTSPDDSTGALVHFNLHFKPIVISEITGDEEELSAEDVHTSIQKVLRRMKESNEQTLNATSPITFGGYVMDAESLIVQGECIYFHNNSY